MLKEIYSLTKDMRQTRKTHTETQAGRREARNERTKALRVLMRKTVMGGQRIPKADGAEGGFQKPNRTAKRERGGRGREKRREQRGRRASWHFCAWVGAILGLHKACFG